MEKGDNVQRNAAYPLPTTPAEESILHNKKVYWFNTQKGFVESYYARADNPDFIYPPALLNNVPVAPDWYPVDTGPEVRMEPTGSIAVGAGATIGGWGSIKNFGGSSYWAANSTSITCNMSGTYEFIVWTNQPQGSGVAEYQMRVTTAGTVVRTRNFTGMPMTASFWTPAEGRMITFAEKGTVLTVALLSGALTLHNGASTGLRGQFVVRYLRPPFVGQY
jgi:hypothetical protein